MVKVTAQFAYFAATCGQMVKNFISKHNNVLLLSTTLHTSTCIATSIYVCVFVPRMDKVPSKVDSNCAIDILHVFQQIGYEILKVEQTLRCLEDKNTLHELNGHVRSYLKMYLNILYQAQVILAGKLAGLKYLQAIYKPYANKINTTVKVQLSTYDVTLLVFLVVSIQALQMVEKENKQVYSCAEKAKKLRDSSCNFVSSNTLIVWPLSVKYRKRPLKEHNRQNEVSCIE